MKICFVLGYPNPFAGAAWTRIGFLATKWSGKGHKMDVLGVFNPSTYRQRGAKNLGAVRIFNLIPNGTSNHPAIFLVNFLFSVIVSAFFVTYRRPDIMIASMPQGDVGLGSIMVCRLFRIKYLVDYRDEWEDYSSNATKSPYKKSFYRLIKQFAANLYSKSCSTVTVTPGFSSSLNFRRVDNIVVVPNGADTSVFRLLDKSKMRQKLNLSEGDFIIVYSGIVGEYYKLDIVVKTLANICDNKNFKLLVVGDGKDLPHLKKLSFHLGLTDRIIFFGMKNNLRQVAEIISASDVGLIPGIYTNGQLAVKFFEYCACGVPVLAIAPSNSEIAIVINENEVGVSLPLLDETELARVLFQLYTDPSFRVEAGKRARILIEEKFDRNKAAVQYLDLIERIIRN